ncbi:PIG-P-domain-containing protein [Pleurotus eryngii]|uniref:PIG-P-domain-containing protein n=1 Tax=Pleurotus eryngii TaxID=5323 RepID=A0A9P6A6V2_PLEER|nr:PIG-P-domain-containing protein [Pleurotus eryngii]
MAMARRRISRGEIRSPTSPVFPVAPFPPLPSPAHHSRAPEFYGFVAWTSTLLLFIVFILWAVLPDEWIVWLGIEWYPNREWTLLLPSYTVVLVLLTYFTYFALAIRATPSFSEMSTITDSYTRIFPTAGTNIHEGHTSARALPQLYDMPIGVVNRVLYSRKKDYPSFGGGIR